MTRLGGRIVECANVPWFDLAAKALTKRADWQEIVQQWLEGYWEPRTPVIELLAGELEDASPLMEILLEHDDPRPFKKALHNRIIGKDPFGNVLILTARCTAEARAVEEGLARSIHDRARQKLKFKFRWRRATQALAWLAMSYENAFETLLDFCKMLNPEDRGLF